MGETHYLLKTGLCTRNHRTALDPTPVKRYGKVPQSLDHTIFLKRKALGVAT